MKTKELTELEEFKEMLNRKIKEREEDHLSNGGRLLLLEFETWVNKTK